METFITDGLDGHGPCLVSRMFFVTLISISQKNEFQTMTYQYVIQYFSRILPTAPSKSW